MSEIQNVYNDAAEVYRVLKKLIWNEDLDIFGPYWGNVCDIEEASLALLQKLVDDGAYDDYELVS